MPRETRRALDLCVVRAPPGGAGCWAGSGSAAGLAVGEEGVVAAAGEVPRDALGVGAVGVGGADQGAGEAAGVDGGVVPLAEQGSVPNYSLMCPLMGDPQAIAIYARISQDRDGEGLGVLRPLSDCHAEAARRGWVVA